MDSACALFLKHGYNAVSLQQICEEIGTTRGAFYWHFKTKEDILIAICERERNFIEGLMVDLFMESGMSPEQHLKYVLTSLVENYFENRRFRDYVELTWFKMEHVSSLPVNHLKQISNEFFIEESSKLISRGRQAKVFSSSCEPRSCAVHMAALINGIYRLYFISPRYMDKPTALSIVLHFRASIKSE